MHTYDIHSYTYGVPMHTYDVTTHQNNGLIRIDSEFLPHEHEFQLARKRGESNVAGSGDPAYSKDAVL